MVARILAVAFLALVTLIEGEVNPFQPLGNQCGSSSTLDPISCVFRDRSE